MQAKHKIHHDILTKQEVAKLLRISLVTLDKTILTAGIPHQIINHNTKRRKIRFSRQAVMEWLAKQPNK